ncbi:hypothetical protein [Paenibacillus sp. FSL E2-0201]|uniref:hypothetical protein n=1 Tax=Paenibacillus sp. FSL E2-0201 TaxID=2954726 RepID=UPI0030DC7EF5
MKKVFGSFLSLTLVLILFGNVSFATPVEVSKDTEVVLYEAEQITDIDLLLERAKNGISDLESTSTENQKMTLKSENNNSLIEKSIVNQKLEEEVELYSTTQLLKVVQKGEDVTETYSTTSIGILSAGSLYGTTDILDGGVVAYSTVNFDRTPNGGLYVYKLISVTGGWNRHDSTLSLSNRIVRYAISGNKNGGGFASHSSGDIAETVNAFGYAAPTTWSSVESSSMIMGVTTEVTITRGSQQWLLRHPNNIQF